jgi:hypothetical protein
MSILAAPVRQDVLLSLLGIISRSPNLIRPRLISTTFQEYYLRIPVETEQGLSGP